ncbi:DC-STAMP domain-containing protein 2-like [Drosophila innubila]|uniref:DC-STAMP domain-containing protein 2-like n=1 Tax=Drosophila innubila TaxID=198719 RepID=UPI00148C796D|nr:DC-STAMP domain-containing protein 2-like [Drosophila innubila]
MGTPYDRCMGAGSISVQECQAKFEGNKSTCNIEQRFDWFCSNLKNLASFFDPNMQQQQEIAEQMFTRPLESFDKIRSIFEVSITFDHKQKSAEDGDKSINDIDLQIGHQLDLEMKNIMMTYIWLGVVIFVVMIMIFLAALYFRINYLDCENFRNIYLTKEFYDYNDQEYTKLGYSALPMRPTERYKYVKLFSCRYLPVEVAIVQSSLVFLVITSLQIFIICFVDLSLFWMLAIMSYHSHQTAELQPPQYTKIHVEGGGMIGYILRGLVKAFEPLSKNLFVDIQHCLPLPGPPKYLRYWEIMMICLFAWILLITEPYFLRARHLIMSQFYPGNARKRAEYLHGRLLLEREIFILESRRKARAINVYDSENVGLQSFQWFHACLYWISCGCFGARKYKTCIICHANINITEAVKCETPKCRGVFCQTCFIESNCHCILCNPPTVYGDYTSYSEIDDSSDDPESIPYRPHNISCSAPKPEPRNTAPDEWEGEVF